MHKHSTFCDIIVSKTTLPELNSSFILSVRHSFKTLIGNVLHFTNTFHFSFSKIYISDIYI